jgi:selenocysteine lyase/cysteine desulfurase
VLVGTPDHAAVHKELGERGIICDFRPDAGLEVSAAEPPAPGRQDPAASGGGGGIRLGPHFYNTEDELRHTVEELADIVGSGAYERHAGAVGRF